MRYLAGIFLLLLFFSSSKVIAQDVTEISTKLSITVEAVQTIELITVNSLRIRDLQPGQQEIYISPTSSADAGYMIAVGTPDTEFQLTYFKDRELTRLGGDGSLRFSYEISGNEEEEQLNSELLDNENRNIRFNSEGFFYLWVGGKVDLSNAKPGAYVGDFTIEIDYI